MMVMCGPSVSAAGAAAAGAAGATGAGPAAGAIAGATIGAWMTGEPCPAPQSLIRCPSWRRSISPKLCSFINSIKRLMRSILKTSSPLDVLSGAARSGFLLDSAIAGPFGQEKIEVETRS